MTDDDQIKLAGELTKAATDSALEPFKEQVTNLLSPFTKEVGETLALHGRLWRIKTVIKIAEKAQKFMDASGIKPHPVLMKLLVPIMEYGSLEEDDSMVDRWASLLAASADTDHIHVLASFPKLLTELSPKEIELLEYVYDGFAGTAVEINGVTSVRLEVAQFVEVLNLSSRDLYTVLDNLHRLRLIELRVSPVLAFGGLEFVPPGATASDFFCLTWLGYSFVQACKHGRAEKRSERPSLKYTLPDGELETRA